jgi:geranylgeranyl pyrophosphate synthase
MDGAWEARDSAQHGQDEPQPLGVGGFLGAVEACLAQALALASGAGRGAALLSEAGRHLGLAPGAKRVRPMMAYLLGELAGARGGLVEVAAAVELIHTASLLHDDVVDGASWRRGREAVNARWGNAAAVLAGDWVLTAALRLLRPWGERLTARAVDVVAEMSAAAALEVSARGALALGSEGCLQMAEGKTGALFGLVGFAAGALAKDPARAARLEAACRALGVAFQVMDDAADLCPSDAETPFQDLREGNPSYPVLWAAEASTEVRVALRMAWSGPVDDAQAAALAALVTHAGGADAARARARRAVEDAAAAFGPDLSHPSVQQLMRWADTLTRAPHHGAPSADAPTTPHRA